MNCEKKSQIIAEDIFKIKSLNSLHKKKFEVIFLDPPYKEKKINNLMKDIIYLKLLKKNGVMIMHRHKKDGELYPKEFKILKTKTYGISKIIFGLIV